MLRFLIECKINILSLKPKHVLKFNPILPPLWRALLSRSKASKYSPSPHHPLGPVRGVDIIFCDPKGSGRMDKLDIAAPGGSHYSGMGDFSAAFASSKENDITLLQIMYRNFFPDFALLR